MRWQSILLLTTGLVVGATRVNAGDLSFNEVPGRFGLTPHLNGEFGTTAFPPLTDFHGHYYRVAGNSPTTVTFRFQSDNGAFTPDFGFYRVSPAPAAIDTSTDAGKIAYATQALAPGNVELLFSNYRENPVRTRTFELNGGDRIGFFSIPHFPGPLPPFRTWLAVFQAHPEQFALSGRDENNENLGAPAPGRWPHFSYTPANPGAFDQMLSLHGTSLSSGNPSSMLLWENASLFVDSGSPFPIDGVFYDGDFNDEVYVVEGIVPIPEPSSLSLLLLVGTGGWIVSIRRR